VVDTAVNGYDVLFSQEGLQGYSAPEWGPQAVRLVYQCEQAHHTSLLISQNAWEAGVRTAADLKGKKIGITPGIPDIEVQAKGTLAFANLTFDDVEVVDSGSYSGLRQMILDGSVDAGFISSVSKEALQMEASPRGVHFVPLPLDDEEGWARFLQQNPMRWPDRATVGAGVSEENPLETSKEPWPLLITYADSDGDKAYWTTKAIRESYDLYKDVAVSLEGCNLDTTLAKMPMYVPWHEGSKKYLQEVGLWTDTMEESQNALIERQAALRALWDEVAAEAVEQEIGAKEWADFWQAKRAEKFPGFYIVLPN
jgi:TRAP transporter TAXI family solute receptor